MALTEEQKRANQRRARKYGRPTTSELVEDESAGWLSARGADFPVERGFGPPIPTDVLRAAGNVPSNVRDEALGLWDIFKGGSAWGGGAETNIAHIMLRAIAGSGEEASRQMLGTPDTENAEIYRLSAQTILDRLTNPRKTLVEEPVSTVIDLATFGTRGALREAGKGPFRAAKKAVTEPYRGARATAEIAGKLTTGHDRGEFQAIREASQLSKATRKEILPYLREQKKATDFAEVLGNASVRLDEMQYAAYRNQLPKLKVRDEYKNVTSRHKVDQVERDSQGNLTGRTRRVDQERPDPLGLHDTIKADLLNMLADTIDDGGYRIDVRKVAAYIKGGKKNAKDLRAAFANTKVGTKVNQERIVDFFEDVFYWTDDSIEGIDLLKQRIYAFKKKGAEGPDYQVANTIVERTYGNVRRVLGERVEGYNKLVGPYEDAIKFKEAVEKVLGMKGEGVASIDEGMINKILPMLRDPANYDIRKSIVADLERAIGKPIAGIAAGLSLRQKIPKNLMPKTLLYGIAGKALYQQAGDPGLLPLLMDLAPIPFTSPRVVGELFSALGAGERTAKHIAQLTRDAKNMIPEGVTDDMLEGLSLGRVIQRYVVPQMEQMEVRERLSGQARKGGPTAIHPPKMPAPLEEEELEQLTPTSEQAAY